MPDLTPEKLAELRRLHAALTPFALSFLTGGPGGDPYIALAAEDGSQLTDAGFDAVLLFAEMASDSLPALLDAAAERDALAAAVKRARSLHTPSRWYLDYCDDPACEREHVECNGNDLFHDDDYRLVCETCSGGELEDTDDPKPYPCPTIRALDESEANK